MFKNVYNNLGLLVAGLLIGINVYSQIPLNPTNDHAELPGGVSNLVSYTDVCPGSTNTFRVEVNVTDAGSTWFEWVVYGGTVTDNNGSSLVSNEASGNYGTVPYFYISHDNYSSGTYSTIDVQWHNVDVSTAWVAVRQHSEWGCFAGPWQVVTNNVFNEVPVIDNFPVDITIPYGSRLNFFLPLPGATDPDPGCISSLTYTYTVTGASNHGPTPSVDDASRTVDLGVGDNLVTWTISDGQKQVVQSYIITVDPDFEILHVAWIDPTCAGNNGFAMVTDVTSMTANASRSFTLEYNFGAGWVASSSVSSLAAGVHTVQARMVYSANIDLDPEIETSYQESDPFSFTLYDAASVSATGIPTSLPDAVVVNTSCLNTSDGAISVSRSAMASQNSAVTFNGSSSYVMLNKTYNSSNSPLSAVSVAAWIRTSSSGGTILSFDNSNYYNLGLSNGRVQFASTAGTATVSNVLYNVDNGAWHLVVATFGSSEFNIYVDGVLALNQAAGSATIGTGITRYGMIGALSWADDFTDAPYPGTYFNGQIAEVAIWEGTALLPSDVTTMFTNGISNVGGQSDHWLLNDLPSHISASPLISSDLGNSGNINHWGRMYNITTESSSPLIFSWTDEATNGTLTRTGLPVGTYELNVKDMYGCAGVPVSYTVDNGDSEEPLILWNAAIEKTASQSSPVGADASLACDGLFSTNTATNTESEAWWMVNLNNNFPVYQVRFTLTAAITNLYVLVSPSALNGATLAADRAVFGIEEASFPSLTAGTYTATFSGLTARYVKIRTADNQAVQLSEVEVLTNYKPSTQRKLYISDNCYYELVGDDATINPVVFDDCGGVSTLSGNSPSLNGGADFNTMEDLGDLPVGTYTVTWTAEDDKGLTSTLAMTYHVVDEEPPYFLENPFATVPNNFTYCNALTYQFPVAKVIDNYHHCSPMASLTLYRDNVWLAYSYPSMAGYDDLLTNPTFDPGLTPTLPTHLKPGNHVFEWRVTDASGNDSIWSYSIHVEVQPILYEVKVSPITCNGNNDGIIYFSNYVSEPSATIEYILRPLPEDPTGSSDLIFSSPTVLTNGTPAVPAGTYHAYIRVNGCMSNAYVNNIVISNPSPIALHPTITNVKCSGDLNGAIALAPTGGSQTNILHLWGDAQVTASDYAALSLDSAGMIECWVYLDSLASGGWNWNADFFGVGASYGLRMNGGVPEFYVGSVTASGGTIFQRTWTHIAGSFTWNSLTASGSITLYINGTAVDTQPLAADPSVVGGTIYMGYNGNGHLLGYVRNARVWRVPMPAYFSENMQLVSPINPYGNLVADYPVNAAGGAAVINAVSTGTDGTVTGTYDRRKFAYLWRGTTGITLPFARDISGQPTGNYTVTLFDPLGCTYTETLTIAMADDDPPSMTFYSDRERGSVLAVGSPIVRYTNDVSGGGNVTGDCYYFPYTYGTFKVGEFDPVVSDGDCPADSVDVTFTVVTGSDAFGTPVPVNNQTLNGAAMTGIITVEWTATDPNGYSDTKTITYYTVDNEPPDPPFISDSTRYTDLGECTFTVPVGGLTPDIVDSCGTGRLYNNITGEDNLDLYVFDPGTYHIKWIYEDRQFEGYETNASDSTTMTLTVLDEQEPTALCNSAFDVYLDDFGVASIDYLDIDAGSDDNCGNIAGYYLSNMLDLSDTYDYVIASTTTSDAAICSGSDTGTEDKAIDGNTDPVFANCSSYLSEVTDDPKITISLGKTVYLHTIRVYNSNVGSPLTNFTVRVAKNGTFLPAPTYTTTYTGAAVSGYVDIPIPAGTSGSYVRITLNGTGLQLGLAEVEFFGSESPSTLELGCSDVQYTPNVNPLVQGTFGTTPITLIVVDEDGNEATCSTPIRIVDLTPPVISTKNVAVPLSGTSPGTVNLNAYIDSINDGTYDACGVDTLWIDDPVMSCANIGTQTVTIHALDVYGNPVSNHALITVADTTAPNYTVKTNILLVLDDDGEHTIVPSDIFATVSDNCTDSVDVFYTFNPAVVTCGNIGYIDLTATITDGNSQTRTVLFDDNDPVISARVQVADLTPPVASLSNFVLTIPTDGDSMIRFQDLISDVNLWDNCDHYAVSKKYISYDNGTSWCPYGSEGTGAASGFTLWEGYVNNYGSSFAAYTGTSLTNLNDMDFDNDNNDVYISDANSGTRSVYYYFSQDYQFDHSSVMWHVDNTLATTLTDISTNNSAIDFDGSATAYGSHSTSNLIDGATSNSTSDAYVTDNTYRNGNYGYVILDFNTAVTASSIVVQWTGYYDCASGSGSYDAYSPDIAEVQVSTNGTSWYTLGTQNLDSDNNLAQTSTFNFTSTSFRFVVVFFEEDQNNRHRIGIKEITVSGLDLTENCDRPTTNTLYYWNSTLSNWTSLGSFSAAAAATFYDLTFSSTITTNAFRLDMTTSPNRRVGIREWRVYGREIPSGLNSACTKYTCADVHKYVPVYLMWEDSHGNTDDTQVDVWVEPYFNIDDLQLKDCGYDGERYYPTLSGLSSAHTYRYIWSEVQAIGNSGDNEDLFEYSNDLSNTTSKIPNGELPYLMPVIGRDWINMSTGDGSRFPDDTDGLPFTSNNASIPDYYEIKLRVRDDNLCYDTLNYRFTYDHDDTQASSIKPWTGCVGEVDTFKILFPTKNSFWRESYNEFEWVNLASQPITIIEGGNSGDSRVIVQYDQSSASFGSNIQINYRYRASQYIGNVTSGILRNNTSNPIQITSSRTLIVTDSLEPGGPYWTADNAYWNQWIQPGGTYITCEYDSWWGDYGACMESVLYDVNVLAVETPIVYAYNAYGDNYYPTNAWIPADSLEICSMDTIWYRVNNYVAGEYAYLDWSISYVSGSDTIYTGRRLTQGNSYDDSIRVVWSLFPEAPRLTVKGYNALDCSSAATVVNHAYTDVDAPVLRSDVLAGDYDCSEMDTIRYTASGRCGFTFTNLPPPLITDDCRNRIANYWCEVDTTGEGVTDFTGKNAQKFYPVGVHTVKWYATDYSDNSSAYSDPCTQTITVIDNQPPGFSKSYLNPVKLYAGSTGVAYFTATTHNLTGTDNCGVASVYARIDTLNDGSWDYGPLATINDPTNIRPFPMGVSLVRWWAVDVNGLKDSISFLVTVADTIRPTIAALDTIRAVMDAGICSHTFASIDGPSDYPTNHNLLWDNSSDDEYLSSHVTFVHRSDGETNLLAAYAKDTTRITWRVTDEAGNYSERKQLVVITDDEDPTFVTPTAALRDTSLNYCKRFNLRLPIPTPSDNCGLTNIDSIVYHVEGGKAPGINYSKKIPRANGVFNPNGTGYTDSIPNLYQYVNKFSNDPDGTDFTVTWWAIDHYGNRSYEGGTIYDYNLHIEIEPVFSGVSTTNMSCGGSGDASIAINTDDDNTPEYHYDRLYTPYFSINNGSNWYATDDFTVTQGGTYLVRMRVNGCLSDSIITANITEPTPYTLGVVKKDVYCFEGDTGKISPVLGGGAAGQLHFTGTGIPAADYDQLDLTTEGSIAAWVYLDNLDNGTIVSKGAAYSLSVSGGFFQLNVGGTTLTASGFTPIDSMWYYVVGTWDATQTQLYIGGVLQATGVPTTSSANTNSVTIGNFDGILRDLSVWNTVISGVAPTSQYNGKETGLVGYWQLSDGVGASAYNTCKVNGWGTDFTGIGSWVTTMPQPGKYTWTKDGGPWSNDIYLTGQGIGRYTVLFVDPFNCPDPDSDPLTATDSIGALDKVPPVISSVGILKVTTDPGVCSYKIDQVAENDYLTPTITDDKGCKFSTEWQLVIHHNQVNYNYAFGEDDNGGIGTKILGAYLGHKDLDSLNTVTVTATQNVDVTSTRTYNIYLVDREDPVPDGRFDEVPSLNLDANGEVVYTALEFNRASYDNCSDADSMDYYLRTSDTDPWASSINLDCDAIGNSVNIQFRVVDQSGNDAVQVGTTTFTVLDVTPPEFILNAEPRGPYCALHDASGGVPAWTEISLSDFELLTTDYTDNCGVTRIRYMRDYDHATFMGGDDLTWQDVPGMDFNPATPVMLVFYQGTTYITFELADGSDELETAGYPRNTTTMMVFTVTVLPKPTPGSGIE